MGKWRWPSWAPVPNKPRVSVDLKPQSRRRRWELPKLMSSLGRRLPWTMKEELSDPGSRCLEMTCGGRVGWVKPMMNGFEPRYVCNQPLIIPYA